MSRFNFCDCPAGFNADPERHAPDCPGRSGAGKRGPTPVPATVETARVEPSVQRFWAEEARNIRCVRAEDFDAHVSRQQTEIAELQQRLTIADHRVDDLQSELTEVQELLEPLAAYAADSANAVMRARAVSARKLLAHQSAPAPKGEQQWNGPR